MTKTVITNPQPIEEYYDNLITDTERLIDEHADVLSGDIEENRRATIMFNIRSLSKLLRKIRNDKDNYLKSKGT